MKKLILTLFSVMLMCSIALNVQAATAEEMADPNIVPVFAKAAFLGDAFTGEMLYGLNEETRVEPASTAKIMTTMLILDAISEGKIALDTPVTVNQSALNLVPSDASHVTPKLQAGEQMLLIHLLCTVMHSSDCAACDVAAEAVAGSVPAFVKMMNDKAALIGCTNTHFTNPSGYPDAKMYTTAKDMFTITRYAMMNQLFNMYTCIPAIDIPATNLSEARHITNTNQLLIPGSPYYNPEVKGVKTGTSSGAGRCLVSNAFRNDKAVISVILGADKWDLGNGVTLQAQFSESNRLLNYGLNRLTQ